MGHERPAWAALARSVLLRAQRLARHDQVLAEELADNGLELHAFGYQAEAARLRLEAAAVHIELGDLERGAELLALAARTGAPSAVQRAEAARVRAEMELRLGRRERARRAVNQGVRTLNDHHAVLGAVELRAFAAASSEGLARIGVRLAVEDGRARELLVHLEATRRTVSLLPAAQPPDDDVLADLLARLRLVTGQQREAISGGRPAEHYERERAALERRIRWHARRAPAGDDPAELAIDESIRRLGDRALLEYANLDGRLYAVSVIGRRSALHDLGPADGLAAQIDSCAFTLHRLNRAQGSAAFARGGTSGVRGRHRRARGSARAGVGAALGAAARGGARRCPPRPAVGWPPGDRAAGGVDLAVADGVGHRRPRRHRPRPGGAGGGT